MTDGETIADRVIIGCQDITDDVINRFTERTFGVFQFREASDNNGCRFVQFSRPFELIQHAGIR